MTQEQQSQEQEQEQQELATEAKFVNHRNVDTFYTYDDDKLDVEASASKFVTWLETASTQNVSLGAKPPQSDVLQKALEVAKSNPNVTRAYFMKLVGDKLGLSPLETSNFASAQKEMEQSITTSCMFKFTRTGGEPKVLVLSEKEQNELRTKKVTEVSKRKKTPAKPKAPTSNSLSPSNFTVFTGNKVNLEKSSEAFKSHLKTVEGTENALLQSYRDTLFEVFETASKSGTEQLSMEQIVALGVEKLASTPEDYSLHSKKFREYVSKTDLVASSRGRSGRTFLSDKAKALLSSK